MSLAERISEMQDYIIPRLEKTGQFEIIEPSMFFGGKLVDSSINIKHEEHIFVKKKKKFIKQKEVDTEEYLILLFPHETQKQKPNENEFVAKIQSASEAGIYVVPLVYKFLNNEGLYWRRETLSREIPGEGFRELPAWIKKSLDQIPKNIRDKARVLSTTLERRWVPIVSNGAPVYYQPKSKRLEEQLIRFRFKDIKADYSHSKASTSLGPRVLKKTIEPIIHESMDCFTLRPMIRMYKGPRFSIFKKKTLKGDFLALHNIDANEDYERNIQYTLGLLQFFLREKETVADNPYQYDHAIQHITDKLQKDIQKYKSQNKQSTLFDPINILINAMNVLMTEHSQELNRIFNTEGYQSHKRIEVTSTSGKIEPPWKIYTHPYPSSSVEGQMYETELMVSTEPPKDILYRCSCPGFKFWHKCWHVKDIMEKYIGK